jgi:hypothetical protein
MVIGGNTAFHVMISHWIAIGVFATIAVEVIVFVIEAIVLITYYYL